MIHRRINSVTVKKHGGGKTRIRIGDFVIVRSYEKGTKPWTHTDYPVPVTGLFASHVLMLPTPYRIPHIGATTQVYSIATRTDLDPRTSWTSHNSHGNQPQPWYTTYERIPKAKALKNPTTRQLAKMEGIHDGPTENRSKTRNPRPRRPKARSRSKGSRV